MQMDVLRCQTPSMVRKELWAHLLAYNLLRSVMCSAADELGGPVREVSFKGTLQVFDSFLLLILTTPREHLPALITKILVAIKKHRVGKRLDRFERANENVLPSPTRR